MTTQPYDLADEVNKARAERDYWRKVAAYLASVHAANYEYDAQLKGVSKSRRARFASICDIAAKALQGKFDKEQRFDYLRVAQERCAEAFAAFEATKPPSTGGS